MIRNPFCFLQTRSLSKWSLCQLKTKSILEVNGKDSHDYLQGLITNDIHHLSSRDHHCLFAFMLNHLGRVIADLFVYKYDDSLLIESDTRVVSVVYKNLLIHKLRRQVTVKKRDDLKVWTVLPSSEISFPYERKIESSHCNEIVSVNDPRVPTIPIYRFINGKVLDVNIVKNCANTNPNKNDKIDELIECDEADYIEFRYRLGLSEGATDHLMGSSFPLESNGDYMNAISFLKGCYVGQELTARTYHTGVTRKRIMPISIPKSDSSLVQGTELLSLSGEDGKKKRIGKVRGIQGLHGLGLIYLEQALKHGWKMYPASEQEIEVTTQKPFWWPQSV